MCHWNVDEKEKEVILVKRATLSLTMYIAFFAGGSLPAFSERCPKSIVEKDSVKMTHLHTVDVLGSPAVRDFNIICGV